MGEFFRVVAECAERRSGEAVLSVRLGLRGPEGFVAGVWAEAFYASFQCFHEEAERCKRINKQNIGISSSTQRQEGWYGPPTKSTLRHCMNGVDAWTDTIETCPPVVVPWSTVGGIGASVSGWRFDVQVAVEERRTVPMPAHVREAQRLGHLWSTPASSERTRMGLPARIRSFTERSLRFPESPGWRVTYAAVLESYMAAVDTGLGTQMSYRNDTAEGHEITLEWRPGDAAVQKTPKEIATSAAVVLFNLSQVLGSTRDQLRARIQEKRDLYEMQSMI